MLQYSACVHGMLVVQCMCFTQVYLADIVPAFLVAFTLPYWFNYVSYGYRFYACALLMFLSFGLVATDLFLKSDSLPNGIPALG